MNETTDATPLRLEQFEILRGAYADATRVDQALDLLIEAFEAGSIRNVGLQALKTTLGHAVDRAWKNTVSEPFFWGKGADMEPALYDLYWDISLTNLHDVIAASKKVAKSQVQGPAIEAMRTLLNEVLPLSLAVADLKTKVVKGRAPSTGPTRPENPNKVVKTCPVCFRAIAVVGGVMAHHGYSRPGVGLQTASCAGIRFAPLEVSSAGLEWLIMALSQNLEVSQKALKESATTPEFLVGRRKRDQPHEEIRRGDPMWPGLFARYLRELNATISSIEHDLPILRAKLADWKPEVQVG